jgi:UDP-N-acetylmuramoyl-tripeptide--D-alanyl-D-alanine ligase
MMEWTTHDILSATGGDLLSGARHTAFAGIGIDSRQLTPDELFIAIEGDIHDGHTFAPSVVARGGRGVLVREGRFEEAVLTAWQDQQVVCIAVPDTTRALGDIAAYHRRRMPARVIALTGSNGKTTTRAMTAAILNRQGTTLATRGNLNNEIGLPLTLLQLKGNARPCGSGNGHEPSGGNRSHGTHGRPRYRHDHQCSSGPPGRTALHRRRHAGQR